MAALPWRAAQRHTPSTRRRPIPRRRHSGSTHIATRSAARPGSRRRPVALPTWRSPSTTWNVATCELDRKSTRLNSSHMSISYAVFCLKTLRPPPRSTLFPYTTLFRSLARGPAAHALDQAPADPAPAPQRVDPHRHQVGRAAGVEAQAGGAADVAVAVDDVERGHLRALRRDRGSLLPEQIGRASCRERVWISVVAGS